MKIEKPPLFTEQEVPTKINGTQLNEMDRERLRFGELTALNEIKIVGEGKAHLVKMRLRRGDEGEAIVDFFAKRDELTVSNEIAGEAISHEMAEKLKAGEAVLLSSKEGATSFLKVDPELNSIMCFNSYELGIPAKVGGYLLRPEDKVALANGNSAGQHVFRQGNNFFTAELELSEDRRSIRLGNAKDLNLSGKELEQRQLQLNGGIVQPDNMNKTNALKKAIDGYDLGYLQTHEQDVKDVNQFEIKNHVQNNVNLSEAEKEYLTMFFEKNFKETLVDEAGRPEIETLWKDTSKNEEVTTSEAKPQNQAQKPVAAGEEQKAGRQLGQETTADRASRVVSAMFNDM